MRTWSKLPFVEEDRLEVRAARCQRLKVHHIYMANALYDAGPRAAMSLLLLLLLLHARCCALIGP